MHGRVRRGFLVVAALLGVQLGVQLGAQLGVQLGAQLGVQPGAAVASAATSARGSVVEDFESGAVVLHSYPGQDHDPDAWEVTAANTYGGSAYALRLHGNTWKTEAVAPLAVTDSTVWQVAVFVEQLGEMQAFGVGDGTNELRYTFAGSQLPQGDSWWTVYQGAFPPGAWYAYLLPIGRDWRATYGYLPVVEQLIYVNDDDQGSPGATLFDAIIDVTDDLPVVPIAEILYTVERTREVARDLFEVGVQFYGQVYDPDSAEHTFAWDFGDSTFSGAQNPYHEFLVAADYTYTVGLLVRDELGLAGNDTSQVRVETGGGELPVTVDFVGDVFTGRTYEEPGGIIETYGVEALFEPTLPILGDAADLSVCNLECAYTDRGTPHPTKSVVFRSRPENIAGLGFAGFDVVNIANNHIVDYGEIGMLDTVAGLEGLGIPCSGAGVNEYFALLPAFWSERGVRLAFLGQCNRTGRQWNYQPFLDAGYNKPGMAYLIQYNLAAAIGATRELADVVVVQMHSGDEYETAPPPGFTAPPPGMAPPGTACPGGGTGSRAPAMGPLAAPPPVEAAVMHPDDPDFRFRNEPTLADRELRRLALDLGADVVINHHPHVLQGFESYGGKLIAHSLGNFVFDLYYPETMPTIVLTLELDKDGITGYRFVPAWIDDFIPQPASGQLGREIMDRMADYSRPMAALVAVDPAGNRARVFLDRAGADSLVVDLETQAPVVEAGGYRVSAPLAVSAHGNLSRVVEVTGDAPGDWEVRWGREILWHGSFEPEGATFWDVNSADERLDESQAHGGLRSLALRRDDGDPGEVGTDLEKHLVCDPPRAHTAVGWLASQNAAGARIMVRFYASRYSENPITSIDVAPRVTGTQEWTRQWLDLDTPANGGYFELRCAAEPPAVGSGLAWFDDLALVEWEPWVAANQVIEVASPNNFRFVQVRSAGSGASEVTVRFAETAYDGETTAAAEAGLPARAAALRLRSFPNPFNPRTTIELVVDGAGGTQHVTVEVYDVLGRRVARLFDGDLACGKRHGLSWNGTGPGGRRLPSGVYFARARAGQLETRRKLLMLR